MAVCRDIIMERPRATSITLFAEVLRVDGQTFAFNEIKFQLVTERNSGTPIFEMVQKQFGARKDRVWGYLKFPKSSDGRRFILFFNELHAGFRKKYRDKLTQLDVLLVVGQAQLFFHEGRLTRRRLRLGAAEGDRPAHHLRQERGLRHRKPPNLQGGGLTRRGTSR